MESWWINNSQKFLGSITTFFSVLGGLLASGAFNNLLSPNTIGWLGVVTALVTGLAGTATVKRGIANTSAERVAAAEATTALAQADTARTVVAAINTPPPDQPVAVPPRAPGA